jgi:hypothetical protein
VNDELKRARKVTVVAYFKVLSQHVLGEIERNHEKSQPG